MPETPRSVLRGGGVASTSTGRDATAAPAATSGSKGAVPQASHSALKMTLTASQQSHQQQGQPAAAGTDGGAPAPIKRILLGHSLGGACAALEVRGPTSGARVLQWGPGLAPTRQTQYGTAPTMARNCALNAYPATLRRTLRRMVP